MKRTSISVLVLCVAIQFPLAGCATSSGTRPNLLATGAISQGPSQPASELPRKQAAAACLATADDLAQAGHEREAIIQYEKARAHDPKLDLSHKLAVLYDRQGEDARALAEYRRALEKSPQNTDLLNDFGYFHYTRGNCSEAEKLLRQATQHEPCHPRAWINLGMALGTQGQFDASFAAFAKVVTPAEARANVAVLQARYGRADEARQSLMLALDENPQLPHARSLLTALPDE